MNARCTFGETLVEGSEGTLRLGLDGGLVLQRLGEEPRPIEYFHERRGFAGDCVFYCQRHFVDRMIDGGDFETSGEEYLRTLEVQEAVYEGRD